MFWFKSWCPILWAQLYSFKATLCALHSLFKLLMPVCIFVVHNLYQLLPWFHWSSFGLCTWYVNQWGHPESDNYVYEASCQGREENEVVEDLSWVAFLRCKSPNRCCKWATLQANYVLRRSSFLLSVVTVFIKWCSKWDSLQYLSSKIIQKLMVDSS